MPRITPFTFEDNPLSSGQYVQVTCLVPEGDLPLKIKWNLNGESLKFFPEVQVARMGKRSSILTIETVGYTNAGNYSCDAENAAGKTNYVAQLQVNG